MKREQLLLTWGGMAFMAMAVLLGCSGSNNQQNGDENEIEIEYSVCTPSALQCKDLDNLEKCNETGDGWLAEKTCASDEYCKKDACIKYTVCKPETLRCKDAEFVEKCGARGNQWVLYKRCRSDEQCSEGNCVKTQQDGDEETEMEAEPTEEEAEQLPCACPGHPEMALVEMPNGDKYCIDRYEATVFENPDCTGKVYGQQEGDWPEDFPVCAGCDDKTFIGDCQECKENQFGNIDNVKINSCSIPGVMPSRYVSFYQAFFACKLSGKEICPKDVWETSCSNENTTLFPYGNEYEKVCYETQDDATHLTAPTFTGAKTECANSCGTFDLMGNLSEFTTLKGDVSQKYFKYLKGSWFYIYTYLYPIECSLDVYVDAKSFILQKSYFGFRCCTKL